jgi:hypothetical protein
MEQVSSNMSQGLENSQTNSNTTLEGIIHQRDMMTVSALLSLSYAKPVSANTKRCRYKQCHQEASKRSPFCQDHIGSRTCEVIDCSKYAQGGTQYCISHGGESTSSSFHRPD